MAKVKQHYMIKMKKGEVHPIFNLDYLPENIASLVETVVLLSESLLMFLFLFNIVSTYFHEYTADFALALILNSGTAQLLAILGAKSNLISNIVALLVTGVAYYFSREYFEFVKYNLHPKKKRARKAASEDTVEDIEENK